MTAQPGKPGAVYQPETLETIRWLRDLEKGSFGIAVDGGISCQSGADCIRAGADRLIIGRSFYREPERAFNNNNREQRAQAVVYAKSMVDMAVELETDKILVVPSQVGAKLYVDKETDWKNSVEALTEVALYAKERGVSVMLECVNKYEVHMVYSLADGVRMAKEIGTGNVGVVADTFHMQLEEKDGIANAIRNTGTEWIFHQHIGDNNREVPGKGCMDWKEILAALRDIGYEGYLSFEPVPAHMGLTEVCTGIYDPDVLEDEMTRSLQMLRGIENLWW